MLMQKAAKQRLVLSHCSVWHKLCGLTLERLPYHPHGCSSEDVLAVCAQWRQVHREAVHLCAALQLSSSRMSPKPLELPAVRCASAAQLVPTAAAPAALHMQRVQQQTSLAWAPAGYSMPAGDLLCQVRSGHRLCTAGHNCEFV